MPEEQQSHLRSGALPIILPYSSLHLFFTLLTLFQLSLYPLSLEWSLLQHHNCSLSNLALKPLLPRILTSNFSSLYLPGGGVLYLVHVYLSQAITVKRDPQECILTPVSRPIEADGMLNSIRVLAGDPFAGLGSQNQSIQIRERA